VEVCLANVSWATSAVAKQGFTWYKNSRSFTIEPVVRSDVVEARDSGASNWVVGLDLDVRIVEGLEKFSERTFNEVWLCVLF
jgi:hypothetical protein